MAHIISNPYHRLRLACEKLHATDAASLNPSDAGITYRQAERRAAIAEALVEGRSIDAEGLRSLVLDQFHAAGNGLASVLWPAAEYTPKYAAISASSDLSQLLTWLRTIRIETLNRAARQQAA